MNPGQDTQKLAIKGRLQDVHPARLYYNFFKAKKTGILTLSATGPNLTVYLQKGVPVCIPTRMASDVGFLDSLASDGLIDRDILNQTLKEGHEEGKSGRDILLEKGFLTKEEWTLRANRYYFHRLSGSFRWRTGQYMYVDHGFTPLPEDPAPSILARLVMEGIEAHYNPQWILGRLTPRMKKRLVPYRKSLLKEEQLSLTHRQKQIMEMARSGSRLQEILDNKEISSSVSAPILFGLLTLELFKFEKKPVEKQSPAKKPSPEKRGEKDRLEKLFDEALESVEKYSHIQPEPVHAEAKRTHLVNKDGLSVSGEKAVESLADPPEESGNEIPVPLDLGTDTEEKKTEDEPEYHLADETPETAPAPEKAAPVPASSADTSRWSAEPDEEGSEFALDRITINHKDEVPQPGQSPRRQAITFSETDSGETLFKIGLTYLEDEHYLEAHLALQEAISRGFEHPEAYAYLGWSIYKDPTQANSVQKADEAVRRSIAMNKEYFFPYIILGRIARDERDHEMAKLWFMKAQELKPDCQEAALEIRKLHEF